MRWNELITGNPNTTYYEYVATTYFSRLQPKAALTIGCGDGYRERIWGKHYRFEKHDAFDLAPKSIESAKAESHKAGLEYLNYFVADANHVTLPQSCYDVVFVEQSLHHIENLEHIIEQVKRALQPKGLFVVNEFVGPTRFQWTYRQLEIIAEALSILPERYRHSITKPGVVKERVKRPRVKDMVNTDPSEAVRSAEIPSLLHSNFKVLEWKEWGGTILHMLFDDIAGNFSAERTDDVAWVSLLCEIEDLLMSQGDIGSDFIFAILS